MSDKSTSVVRRIDKELDSIRDELAKKNNMRFKTDADKEIAKEFKKVRGKLKIRRDIVF